MRKIPNGYEVIQLFEQYSPKGLALEGDKIGLQIGTLNKPVKNVLIVLDVLEETLDEAIEKNIDLIIAHHPPLFRSLKSVITDQFHGRLIEKCMKNDIAIYAAHTNLDVAMGGVNDLLANALQLKEVTVLSHTYEESLKKLIVYVPSSHATIVRQALGDAGAGNIGNYSHCSFESKGTGTFLPLQSADPFIGVKGSLERVEEVKIETIFESKLQKKVISAMLKAHPYEEVAYDIFPLENKGESLGLGRIGILENEMTLKEFAEHVKKSLDVEFVRVVGDFNDSVRKVAVLGGDGNKYISQAKFKGADVFVSGDMYYHVAHDAMAMGLNIVDPGHHIEKVMKKGVAEVLSTMCDEKNFAINISYSERSTDPFKFL
ncbi:Nif3-like dinuclear metal center hexameric protein [Bacillus timonensis]|nr:Nif3-like dinuclear metal center hexameric protein [Bacillus timonensis]